VELQSRRLEDEDLCSSFKKYMVVSGLETFFFPRPWLSTFFIKRRRIT